MFDVKKSNGVPINKVYFPFLRIFWLYKSVFLNIKGPKMLRESALDWKYRTMVFLVDFIEDPSLIISEVLFVENNTILTLTRRIK